MLRLSNRRRQIDDPLEPHYTISDDEDIEINSDTSTSHEGINPDCEFRTTEVKDQDKIITDLGRNCLFCYCSDMRQAAVFVNVIALLFNLTWIIYLTITMFVVEQPSPTSKTETEDFDMDRFIDYAALAIWVGAAIFSLFGIYGALKFSTCGLETALRYYGFATLSFMLISILGKDLRWEPLVISIAFGIGLCVHCILIAEFEKETMSESNYESFKYCCRPLNKIQDKGVRKVI